MGKDTASCWVITGMWRVILFGVVITVTTVSCWRTVAEFTASEHREYPEIFQRGFTSNFFSGNVWRCSFCLFRSLSSGLFAPISHHKFIWNLLINYMNQRPSIYTIQLFVHVLVYDGYVLPEILTIWFRHPPWLLYS